MLRQALFLGDLVEQFPALEEFGDQQPLRVVFKVLIDFKYIGVVQFLQYLQFFIGVMTAILLFLDHLERPSCFQLLVLYFNDFSK